MIIKYRKDFDFKFLSEEGLNAIELASKLNFVDCLKFLLSVKTNFCFFQTTSVLRTVINYKSNDAFSFLVSHLTSSSGYLDEIFSKSEFSLLWTNALTENNIFALKIILQNSKSQNFEDFIFIHEDSFNSCNIIHFATELGRKKGIEVLVKHFGKSSLMTLNKLGQTPFLVAVSKGDFDLMNKIIELNHNSIFKPDFNGNNALHIAVSLKLPLKCIKFLADLNMNWEAENFSGVTPLDLFENHALNLESEFQEDLNYIANRILQNKK